MKWNEGMIARAISLQTLNRRCVLLVNRCIWTGHECDVLGVTTDLRIIDVEIKISRADLKADAKKEKWWHRKFSGHGPAESIYSKTGQLLGTTQSVIYDKTARYWPPKVWKHYYAMPADIWTPDLLDSLPGTASGILLLSAHSGSADVVVHCQRRAAPNKDAERLSTQNVMDIARLANLRMWEAYGRAGALAN